MKSSFLIVSFISLCLLISNPTFAKDEVVKDTGDILLFALPIATLTTTFINNDKVGRKQFLKGFLLNAGVTISLKYIIGKQRPDLSDNLSFPSGHTSVTFQSATFIHRRYGIQYSIPAFALAGLTAYSRIDAKKHDGWDILAGALIGISSSVLFTSSNKKTHIQMTYNSANGNHLAGLVYSF